MNQPTLTGEARNIELKIEKMKKDYSKYQAQYDEAKNILNCIKAKMRNCKIKMTVIDLNIKGYQNYVKEMQYKNSQEDQAGINSWIYQEVSKDEKDENRRL